MLLKKPYQNTCFKNINYLQLKHALSNGNILKLKLKYIDTNSSFTFIYIM